MRSRKEGTERCFVDTNIWLYAFIEADDSPKHQVAKEVVSRPHVVVSTQVINETCVNLLKKASLSEATIRQLVAAFYEKYAVNQYRPECIACSIGTT